MQFKDELNPIIWDKDNDNQMRPEVNAKLREIADAFIEYIEIPEEALIDVVVTGSSASYNYNEHSDLDLHIIVDYDKIHEDCPLVEGYLGALKNTFNKEHDIFIKDIPVELYAEKQGQGTVHNGLYSVWKEEWIDRPEKIEPTDNDAAVEAKYQEIKEMVDKCDDSEAATELLEKIYTMRKAGLAEAGEFCTENLAFKKLRNEGCMDKLRQLKKEQIDKQLSLESYEESIEDLPLKEQIKQLFPWIYSATIYNIGEVFDDRGIIKLSFEIPGGRHDNEIFLWVFKDTLEIWFTNGSLGGRSSVGSIKIDPITKDNFITSVMDLLKLVKPTIEEFYRKEEKQQKEKYSKARIYNIEDDEKELYAFISKALKTIKKKLNKEFSIHQTDNTIYINYDKKPENTVFVEPMEDSTQILKIGLLDDTNDEIDYKELDLQDFGKADIDNIINITKELFMIKNESIKENKMNEALDLSEKDIEQLTKHFRKTYSAEAVENYIESLKREFDNIKWYKKANWKDAYHFDWEPCSFEEVVAGTTRLRTLIFALNTTLRDPRLPQELKGKHFEDGFKAELPWPEEFNFVENKMNEAEGIYKPSLILEAYKKEQEWLKSLELGEDERAPEIMLFIIENDEIKDTKLIKREDVYTYKPEENEYYLDMFRDSGDVLTDYNLEPAQKLVDRWNEFKKEESMENKNEDVATLMDKVDAADAELKELIKSLSLREELESLIEKALEE